MDTETMLLSRLLTTDIIIAEITPNAITPNIAKHTIFIFEYILLHIKMEVSAIYN